ncbi:MAG: hypothetical protein IJI73_08500 [Kiritimatiellae bacterium]|nr:hypothetical protein [Kiritimatiellia bacterium]
MTSLAIIAALAVRNPFWPIGYEGEKEEITAEPIVEVQITTNAEGEETATAAAAAELAKTSLVVSPRNWAEARKTLRISGTTVVTDQKTHTRRQAVIINGLTYGNGDLISINHDGHRFTWRIQGLTEGATIRLVRVRAKSLDDEEAKAPDNKNPKEND